MKSMNLKITIRKKKGQHSPVAFSQLNKEKQEKVLRHGANEFSRRFTKVIVKMANE